jgi:capsular exopolysaccharide synthesis family protein
MSRVYEALRQSELETGVTPTLLDPDTFVSGPAATEQAVEQPVAGLAWSEIRSLVPAVREESRVVALTEGNRLGAEKFRLLRARLRNLRERNQIQKLVITSAVPNEGKTVVAMNLAVCLAKHTNEKILLLEGDLRKPMLGEHLGIKTLPGVGEWWASAEELVSKFIYRFDDLQLWILPAGSAPENPVNILQSARFLDLYKQLSTCFDWIIIDAPPLLPMADVSFWSRQVDGLLLVVREGHTPKALLQKGLETLDNPKVIGVVLNDAHDVESAYYDHYYYHQNKGKTRPETNS